MQKIKANSIADLVRMAAKLDPVRHGNWLTFAGWPFLQLREAILGFSVSRSTE